MLLKVIRIFFGAGWWWWWGAIYAICDQMKGGTAAAQIHKSAFWAQSLKVAGFIQRPLFEFDAALRDTQKYILCPFGPNRNFN